MKMKTGIPEGMPEERFKKEVMEPATAGFPIQWVVEGEGGNLKITMWGTSSQIQKVKERLEGMGHVCEITDASEESN